MPSVAFAETLPFGGLNNEPNTPTTGNGNIFSWFTDMFAPEVRDYQKAGQTIPSVMSNSVKSSDKDNSASKMTINDVKDADSMVDYLKQNLSAESLDYLVDYYLSEQSNVNAYKRSLSADSTKYQRAVDDLKKAGLNPWLSLQSLSGSQVASGSSSYGSSTYTSGSNNRNTNATNKDDTILRLLGTLATALIGAMLVL